MRPSLAVRERAGRVTGLLAISCLFATSVDAVDLEARWRRTVEELAVESPAMAISGSEESIWAEQLFDRTLDLRNLESSTDNGLSDFEALRRDWATLGLTLWPGESGGELFLILEEAAEARQGRGFFVFRPAASNRTLAIQAPHAVGDDRDTAEIGFSLLRHSGAAVGVWSTVSRKRNNLTGESGTLFQVFTEVFADRGPRAKILQLHGFSRSKRRTEAGRQADVILSNGTRHPPPHLGTFADCLAEGLSLNTRVYPHQVRELGATTNAQSIALAARGHPGFIHFEMARPLRRQLRADPTVRAALLTCIDTTLSFPETR